MGADASIFYNTKLGRATLSILFKLGMPKIMASYLNCSLSKPMIKKYIKKYDIDLSEYEKQNYKNFGEFFARKKINLKNDFKENEYISPCDGLLSCYSINKDSAFNIKGSLYRICDLVKDEDLANLYNNGLCLIFRLRPNDYHHYIFSDDGYCFENHYIEGQLHSVQPIACEKYPVYRLNRRVYTKIDTKHFGTITQIEIGAMAVGGIVNNIEEQNVKKGQEMGYFSLCGSTIVQLIQKDKLKLNEEFLSNINFEKEFEVSMGTTIGNKS